MDTVDNLPLWEVPMKGLSLQGASAPFYSPLSRAFLLKSNQI